MDYIITGTNDKKSKKDASEGEDGFPHFSS